MDDHWNGQNRRNGSLVQTAVATAVAGAVVVAFGWCITYMLETRRIATLNEASIVIINLRLQNLETDVRRIDRTQAERGPVIQQLERRR